MHSYLLFFHSLFRWLVSGGLLYTLYRGFKGWSGKTPFTRSDDRARHITATLAHIQLALGYTLYFNSPIVRYFRSDIHRAARQPELLFFGMIHILIMTLSVILLTIGSSAAKRQNNDRARFRTMTIFFALALVIIFMAIPWPFSPFAKRPYFRHL